MGLNASIFKSDLGDCSAGGISATHNNVNLVNADGPFDPNDKHPPCMLIRGAGHGHVICVPAENVGGRWVELRKQGASRMCGGTFVSTSDSRFHDLVDRLGGRRGTAVSFHDRFETYRR